MPFPSVYLWPNPLETDPIYDENGDLFPSVGGTVELNEYYQNLVYLGILLTFLEGGSTTGPVIPGAGEAPASAAYVVISPNGTLTNERTLAAGTGITITDGGANGAVTIASTTTPGNLSAQYVTLATDSSLTNERVLTAGSGITITDGGANGPVTVASTVTPGNLTAQYVTLATDASLTNERVLTAGAGLTMTDGGANGPVTLDVVAGDGSIVVGANSLAVGVISDTQHGDRSGGSLHELVTSFTHGFMASTDKVKLDGIASGAAALTAAAPAAVTRATAVVGVSTTAARADHKHDITTGVPSTVGTANAEGTSTALARQDHVHSHGNQAGGALHAVVTTSVNGFMSAADKTKLDGIATGATALALTNANPTTVSTVSNTVGIATDAARADHRHVLPTRNVNARGFDVFGWPINPDNRVFDMVGIYPTQRVIATGLALPDNVWYIDITNRLPPNATNIRGVTLTVQGGAGHGALPVTMPTVNLTAYNPGFGPTSYFTVTDTSVNVAAYEAIHTIAWTGGPFSVALATSRLILTIVGENGSNAIPGFKALGLLIDCDYV